MSKEHLENIAFDFIRYSNCWEDPELLLEAFQLTENSRVLSIASGGDNCFSLLSQGVKQLVAVDISSVQLYLLELKKVAIQHSSRNKYLQFAGFSASDDRLGRYKLLRAFLSREAQIYWDQHLDEIYEGIIHIGKFERYFQLFKKEFLHTIHDQTAIDGLFDIKSKEDQLKYYETVWFDTNWEKMHSTFFSERMLGERGRDPEFMKQIDGSVPELILNREIAHLKNPLCQTNPFLYYILNNQFDEEHLPHYVRKENYNAVKENLDKLILREGLIGKIAAEYSDISHFNLSNIFEYMDIDHFKLVSKSILNHSSPKAILAYWNFMVHRNIIDILPKEIIDLKEESKLLSSQDMGYFYKGFKLNQKK